MSMRGFTFRAAYTHLREACASVEARRAAVMPQCIVKARGLEHGQEHGLQRREDNGEALPHAARKAAAKIRARARAKKTAPKTLARGSTRAQDRSRCDSPDGHNELRAKGQSLCAESEWWLELPRHV